MSWHYLFNMLQCVEKSFLRQKKVDTTVLKIFFVEKYDSVL